MSFIDLMGDTVWTDADIARRANRLVLNQFTRQQIRDLDDMVTGASAGLYALTPEEEAKVQAYSAARLAAREERVAAERDNELLAAALAAEQAARETGYLTAPDAEVLALIQTRGRDLTPPAPAPAEEPSLEE